MAKVSRNAPCPCNSGKKFKHCHLLLGSEDGEDVAGVDRRGPMALGMLSAVGAVGTAFTLSWTTGLMVGGAGALLAVAWMVFQSPPPKREGAQNPAGLDFGRE